MLASVEMRVQLNVRVSDKTRQKVQDDAERMPRATRDIVVETILKDFFTSWTLTERQAYYRKFMADRKTT